jgi:hypothetical protein
MMGIMMEKLKLAEQSLAEGKLLLHEKMGNKVVLAKIYHAMTYSLFALFDSVTPRE